MAGPQTLPPKPSDDGNLPPISGSDSARYTRDLLESLKRLALGHDQFVLAHLLEAAAREAERVTRNVV